MNKNDIKLIIFIIIIGFVCIFLINFNKEEGNVIEVYYEDKLILSADLNIDNVYTVDGKLGDVVIEVKATGKKREINFENHKVGDIEEIMAAFPQDVLYTDTGVLKYILNNFIQPMNDSFDKHTCYQCGEVHEKGDVDTTESFF